MDNKYITGKVAHLAHEVAFVVQQYPDKTLPEYLELIQQPAVYINGALWAAEDLGLIETPNKDTGAMKFKAEPELGWDFGQDVVDLQNALLYCMGVVNKREDDIEENFLANWTAGNKTLDVLVAMRHLLVERKLFEYEITDIKSELEDEPSTYIFYTLFENAEMQWGRKNFKVDPTADKKIQPEK